MKQVANRCPPPNLLRPTAIAARCDDPVACSAELPAHPRPVDEAQRLHPKHVPERRLELTLYWLI
ncbi:hypothetical protein E1200_22080 [Actinomadura sp. GC306]|uniref:hypothetical protein n=1 Tax=Actinomadura sp. GC306 TaxID=2530367 RepID=UPI001050DC31|nr:hypothetical protein [Actinomadura sp. GC306]TDC63542.1 hypothetical protein E1200_22080 [Actinomadura sp. GC306]